MASEHHAPLLDTHAADPVGDWAADGGAHPAACVVVIPAVEIVLQAGGFIERAAGVQSARLYQLDVTAYLTDVLRRLPGILPSDTAAIRALLPDQWAQANPKHIHASRDEEQREDNARRRRSHTKRRRATVQ